MNLTNLYTFATTESAKSGGLLESLGVDIPTLIFQIVAFLLLVFVLGKWVYPVFMGIVDKRQAEIEASTKAADEAKQKAAEAEAKADELLREARAEAGEIISIAKNEASAAVSAAEKKAQARAETIVQSAEDDIKKQVADARKTLHNETLDLVAEATERVLGKTVTAKVDDAVITQALKEAK